MRQRPSEGAVAASPPTMDINTTPNYLSKFAGGIKSIYDGGRNRFSLLSGNQQLAVGVALVMLTFLPLIWLLIVSPLLVIAVTIVYSLLFGFNTFIAHIEATLHQTFGVSNQVSSSSIHRCLFIYNLS